VNSLSNCLSFNSARTLPGRADESGASDGPGTVFRCLAPALAFRTLTTLLVDLASTALRGVEWQGEGGIAAECSAYRAWGVGHDGTVATEEAAALALACMKREAKKPETGCVTWRRLSVDRYTPGPIPIVRWFDLALRVRVDGTPAERVWAASVAEPSLPEKVSYINALN
jgi:hypothetical protein